MTVKISEIDIGRSSFQRFNDVGGSRHLPCSMGGQPPPLWWSKQFYCVIYNSTFMSIGKEEIYENNLENKWLSIIMKMMNTLAIDYWKFISLRATEYDKKGDGCFECVTYPFLLSSVWFWILVLQNGNECAIVKSLVIADDGCPTQKVKSDRYFVVERRSFFLFSRSVTMRPIVTKVPSAWTMLQMNEIVLIGRSSFQRSNDVGGMAISLVAREENAWALGKKKRTRIILKIIDYQLSWKW